MGKVLLYTRSRPPQPPEAAAQNARDDEAHARCVSFVRANARGEVEGLFGPDSVSWAMYREPATLFAGLSAVMLQMAHPAIAAGVSQHSTFAEDLRGRAARTSAALYRLVFGTLDDALDISRGLHRMHSRVWGRVDAADRGAYRANDQTLLRWVAATVTVAGEQAFEALVRPLTDAERDRSYREMQLANAAVGVAPESLPGDRVAFDGWYARELQSPALAVGPTARNVAAAIERSALFFGPFDALLTAGFLPPAWREAYGFRWGRARQAQFDAALRGLRGAVALSPAPYRYVVAWHQATARVARHRGASTGRYTRALDALGRRWRLPTGLGA
jgi:uncharacterized protein (DUF2236 family)